MRKVKALKRYRQSTYIAERKKAKKKSEYERQKFLHVVELETKVETLALKQP